MFPEFSKNMPSFIPLSEKKRTAFLPDPPNRKAYRANADEIKSKKASLTKSISSRHQQCFQSPVDPYCSQFRREPLYRSRSAGPTPTLSATPKAHRRQNVRVPQRMCLHSASPARRQTRLDSLRQYSQSPVAFGRSISKERTFAEEKKRLENSLPLKRNTFEASTNILRDPSLKSPQDVREAVRSLAKSTVQTRSKSVPRMRHLYRKRGLLGPAWHHTISSPQFQQIEVEEYSQQMLTVPVVSTQSRSHSCSRLPQKYKVPDGSPPSKKIPKTTSTVCLTRTNSTFSLGSPVLPITDGSSSTTLNMENRSRRFRENMIISNYPESNLQNSKSDSSIPRKAKPLYPINSAHTPKATTTVNKITKKHSVEVSQDTTIPPQSTYILEYSTPRDKQNIDFDIHATVCERKAFWNDFSKRQANSLPRKHQSSSRYKTRSLSPSVRHIIEKNTETCLKPELNHNEMMHFEDLTWQYRGNEDQRSGTKDAQSENSNSAARKFSPTREVRIPQVSRSVRSPSRRKIETCRTNPKGQSSKSPRPSSLSSADDRSRRGLYLCRERAHSATSLTNSERHSPTCRYRSTSERFAQLNRFYNTLERVGQLEKATSTTNFRPIRKSSELLDYEEWRKIRCHEQAEKELNYLVNKLKRDQREKDLLFRPKEISDFKWRMEADFGLHSKEKSVEDLRDNFERTKFRKDCQVKHFIRKPYWRTNTVAAIASSLEERSEAEKKYHNDLKDHSNINQSDRSVGAHSKDFPTSKIHEQFTEIFSTGHNTGNRTDTLAEYTITVDHSSKPSPSANALKVRSNSSIRQDELYSSIMRKKNILSNSKAGAQLLSEVKPKFTTTPPQVPQRPDKELEKISQRNALSSENDDTDPTSMSNIANDTKEPGNIIEKIQFFEERKFDEPPKTIYHAREDSSPDEEEVMRLIEEKMRLRETRECRKHKELSQSLTDINGMFGQRGTDPDFLHSHSPPERASGEHKLNVQESQITVSQLGHQSEALSPESSLEIFESHCGRRGLLPPSQPSSYLQRVSTGEVQKIKQKFESLDIQAKRHTNLYALRKVRSNPEINANDSGPEDTPKTVLNNEEHGNVSWIMHKYEVRNRCVNGRTPGKGRRKRTAISPVPLKDRLMPHIDIISKTAALGKRKTPTRTASNSSSGLVERIRNRYEDISLGTSKSISISSPDIRSIQHISEYLRADWIAHKYPSPKQNNLTANTQSTKDLTVTLNKERFRRPSSPSPPISPTCRRHCASATLSTSSQGPTEDIFANQKFDPRAHQPKARYVPDGAETWPSPSPPNSSTNYGGLKRPSAVKFQVSPNRYYESDVNIHFKTPVRQEFKSAIPEEELAARQAEQMQKLYQEERRRKYLQELQDMNARRHTDNFTPSQKSPIPLNRYDDFASDLTPKSPSAAPHTRTVARALYNFQGQNARELSFKKGDIIYIRRAIDKNWYEGEHHAMLGLFPANYVEIIGKESSGHASQQRKPAEGQARAKYTFQAQSGVELSLNKGELVTLTRRVDDNWFEGRIANRKGIFPVSYVEVLSDIGAEDVAAKTGVSNLSSTTNGRPSLNTLRTNINDEFNALTKNGTRQVNGILKETRKFQKTDILHVDTTSEPLAYRALYKYRPQNSDELELLEGDVVHVLEKCDDGWFVGTSLRTGCFGTFPGNYVERL